MKRVLSLFNGMSCGEMAFESIGQDVEVFYSEVDKWANKATELLYPDSIPIGDVRQVNGKEYGKVDYLIGGSPCQSFSFAGKRNGMSTKDKEEITTLERYLELKQQGFEFEGQSYLFWEYIRVLREVQEVNPDVEFLLENVVMSKKWENIISKTLGVAPVLIDSSLVSAQQRKRLYWTNINKGEIPQPEDKNIVIKDIVEMEVVGEVLCGSIVGRRLNENGTREDYNKALPVIQTLEVRSSNAGKTKCLTTVQKDNVVTTLPIGRYKDVYTSLENFIDKNKITTFGKNYVQWDINNKGNGSQDQRAYYLNNKHGTLSCGCGSKSKLMTNITAEGVYYRKLTVRECMRLQTVSEDKIDILLSFNEKGKRHISDSQLYKMAGNGWTVEVIAHILKQEEI